ncbi:insulin-like peptide 1 [Penaeus vannamei]|uniref:Insulin-like peptide 1 n=1 Tax=Penaeus vannamei TaxID=6689 RepID=A0A3R7NTE1_PENVA|nr:insulin-like peptide 1 [Penaeus vannamei]
MVMSMMLAVFLLCSTSLALDPDFVRQIESRTELEWQALWSEERLALCRAKLRQNLDAICGKDVFRRSSVERRRRRDKRDEGRDGSKPLPAESDEVPRANPSTPDTGQAPDKRRSPFLSVQQANLFVTTWVHDQGGRRRAGPLQAPSPVALHHHRVLHGRRLHLGRVCGVLPVVQPSAVL